MENAKILHFPVSFTKEDIEHCFSCILFVNYLLDTDTDGEPSVLNLEDVKYLERLLHLEYARMRAVVEAAGGPDNVI